MNFYGVERIIDALGGVNVWSPREFDERFVYLDTDEEIRLVLEPGVEHPQRTRSRGLRPLAKV